MIKVLTLTLWLSTAADYQSGFQTGRELNPVLGQNKVRQAAFMVVSSGIATAAAHYLERKGHGNWSKAILIIGTGAHAGAAMHNYKERWR